MLRRWRREWEISDEPTHCLPLLPTRRNYPGSLRWPQTMPRRSSPNAVEPSPGRCAGTGLHPVGSGLVGVRDLRSSSATAQGRCAAGCRADARIPRLRFNRRGRHSHRHQESLGRRATLTHHLAPSPPPLPPDAAECERGKCEREPPEYDPSTSPRYKHPACCPPPAIASRRRRAEGHRAATATAAAVAPSRATCSPHPADRRCPPGAAATADPAV
jgi:hypothetical protein